MGSNKFKNNDVAFGVYKVKTKPERDALLTTFGKATLRDSYLLEGEEFQDLFARVAGYYAVDQENANLLYEYISKLWFMPATPILSNGGSKRGLPISCYLNETTDSLEGIVELWTENVWLASQGGGIGSYWGKVRSINEEIKGKGTSSGIIPFIKVMDTMTLAISQASIRRGSAAVYLPIDHPEIEEFIDLRRATGGDYNRKALNLHHGVVISDIFMEAVENDTDFNLISPSTGKAVQSIKARELWVKLITTRLETGEPYMLFIDTINRNIPEHHKKLGLKVKSSNLCAEITLNTGIDHLGKNRTAVCCLSSLNLEYYEEWKDDEKFIPTIMRFLDRVLEDFIIKAPPSMANAKYAAMRERSVGLGVMGFHSFLQMQNVPIESVMSKVWNNKIFEHISNQVNDISLKLGALLGPCPDAAEVGSMERFSNKTAIAPTASISIIAGNASPGIDPYTANSFSQKTRKGTFVVRNKVLEKLLQKKGFNTEQVWSSIATNEGSVQHLSFLNEHEKAVYKTAFEIDQRWIIDLAGERSKFITQGQSLNIFIRGDVHKKELHDIHFRGWKNNVKAYYYARSTSIQRADKVSHEVEKVEYDTEAQTPQCINAVAPSIKKTVQVTDYEECLACQ